MIEQESKGELRILRLARAPVNALNAELVNVLRETLNGVASERPAGVVLTGRPGKFSAGLDLKELLAMDRPTLKRFWQDFFALLETLASYPVPLVAAISGHCPAGGAVLSLYCDRRIAVKGPFKIGLNEVQVGLVVPGPIQAALVRLLGAHAAEGLMVRGALLSPEEAEACGMVDELVSADGLLNAAGAWLEALTALPREAMLGTRSLARQSLAAPFAAVTDADVEAMVDGWFSAPTQASLTAVLSKLEARKSGG